MCLDSQFHKSPTVLFRQTEHLCFPRIPVEDLPLRAHDLDELVTLRLKVLIINKSKDTRQKYK